MADETPEAKALREKEEADKKSKTAKMRLLKIRFTQKDRTYGPGEVLEVGKGVASEYVKRGVAEYAEEGADVTTKPDPKKGRAPTKEEKKRQAEVDAKAKAKRER